MSNSKFAFVSFR